MTPTREILSAGVRHFLILSPRKSTVLEAQERKCVAAHLALGKVRTVGKFFIVGIGGFMGSILRFWLGVYIGQRMGTRFPYGTFVINVSGSFLIGFVMTVLTEKTHLSPNWRYLIPIGFIGGYTTFSTFEFETLRAIQDGQLTIGTLNVVLSVLVGFLMVWTGAMAGRMLA